MLGGVAEEWSERIDPSSISSFIWPRALATAERLWSPAEKANVTEAFPRLRDFRCHVVRRGTRANNLHPGTCWAGREDPM